ncbi:MAG: hypothetical protein M3256_26920 [Actinomycetota bacterium]|nr:hypothetical protein [Actinomycetota bacterium]
MSDPFAAAGADYLEQVLQAAMQAPAAAGNPASGEIVARLMVALVSTGEDARLDPYLAFEPGRSSVCEVRWSDGPDKPPAAKVNLRAAEALRIAAGVGASDQCTAQVYASDGAGRERCVFLTRGSMATYLFPDSGASLTPVRHPSHLGPSTTLSATDQLLLLTEMVGTLPTRAEVVGALRELLTGMTVEVDATAIEDVIFDAVEQVSRSGAVGSLETAGGKRPAAPPLSARTPQPQTIEQLARLIVAQLVEEQRMPQAEEVAQAMAPLIPTPAQIAELVVARMANEGRRVASHRTRGPALRSVPANGSPPQSGGGAEASSPLYPEAEAAMERLDLWRASL